MDKIVSGVQKILVTVFLIVIYFVGFGVTCIIVTVFDRKLLRFDDKNMKTFWKDAKDYGQDVDECARQS